VFAELASDYGAIITCGRPPLALVMIWYATLLGALTIPLRHFRRVAIAATVASAIAVSIVSWNFLLASRQTTVTVAAPTRALAPVVLVQSPGAKLLINTGSRYHGRATAQWLRLQGIGRLDAIILPLDKASWNGALSGIGATIPIARVFARVDTAEHLSDFHRTTWHTGAQFHPFDADFTFLREGEVITSKTKGRASPSIALPYGIEGKLTLSSQKSTGWQVTMSHPNGHSETISAPAKSPATVTQVHW
jgi:beta-lactamase superfamily II metal-dependent hydrolase